MDDIVKRTLWYDSVNRNFVVKCFNDKNIKKFEMVYGSLQELVSKDPTFASIGYSPMQEYLEPIQRFITLCEEEKKIENNKQNESIEPVETPTETTAETTAEESAETTAETTAEESAEETTEDIRFGVEDFRRVEDLLKTICSSSGPGFLGSLSGIGGFISSVKTICTKQSTNNITSLNYSNFESAVNDNVVKLNELVGGTSSPSGVSLSTLYERAKKINAILDTFGYDYDSHTGGYTIEFDKDFSVKNPDSLNLYFEGSKIAGFEMKKDGSGYLYDGMAVLANDKKMYYYGEGTYETNRVHDVRNYYDTGEYGMPEDKYSTYVGRIVSNCYYNQDSGCKDEFNAFFCDKWEKNGSDPVYNRTKDISSRSLPPDALQDYEQKLYDYHHPEIKEGK